MEAESTWPGTSSGDLAGCVAPKLSRSLLSRQFAPQLQLAGWMVLKTSPLLTMLFFLFNISISSKNHPGTHVTMSFGFGVGDFLAVIQLANKIRKDFAGAPSEFNGALDV